MWSMFVGVQVAIEGDWWMVRAIDKINVIIIDIFFPSFSLAESSPRDLLITAYK